MQYWVYHDARVLGPFSKEDLASVQGLDADSLVSKADSSSGAREGDWTALGSLPELMGLYDQEVGVALAPAAEHSPRPFDHFREESHDILDRIGYPEAWISGIFEDPRMFDVHAGLGGTFAAEAPAKELEHTAELENRLCQLQDQLEEYEQRQNAILDKLGEKDRTIEELKARLEKSLAAKAAPPKPVIAEREPLAPVVEEVPPSVAEIASPTEDAAPPAVEAIEAVAEIPVLAGDGDIAPPAFDAQSESSAELGGHSAMEIAAQEAAAEAPPAMEVMESAPPPMDVVEVEAPPSLQMEEEPLPIVSEAPKEEGAVPGTVALSSVSSMPDAEEFVPPSPDDVAPPLEAPPLEAPPLEAPPLEAPPFEAPPFEAPPLEPPPLSGPVDTAPTLEPPSLATEDREIPPLDPPPFDMGMPPLTAPPANLPAGPDDLGGMGSFDQPKTMTFGAPPLQDPAFSMQPPVTLEGSPPPETFPPYANPMDLAPGAMPGQMPTPMPIPLGGTTTPMPAMGQPDIPQTVLQGMGVGGTTTPLPGTLTPPGGQSFEELMGRPATVVPQMTPSQPMDPLKTGLIQPLGAPTDASSQTGATASKLQKFKSKKVLIGLGLAVVTLVVLFLLFFRNPNMVKQLVDMSPEQKAPGALDGGQIPGAAPGQESGQAPPSNPFAKRPQPDSAPSGQAPASPFAEQPPAQTQQQVPQQQVPPQQFPPPQPAATSDQGRDFIQDNQVQAMEFVKGYMLSGTKGTVEGWLNYSFPPPAMPQWSAGPISKDVWSVEYLVFKGPRSKKPEITYSFEVNLTDQELKPLNSSTRSLLAGSQALNKKSSFNPPTKALQPLPGDDEISGGDAQSAGGGFNNPGGY
ncbi:MAG: hypothetical protein ABIJ96_18405 [Elusimicrobiota bacterium]